MLNQQIIYLHSIINGQAGSDVKEEVIVLDYLVTLRQLLLILEEHDLQTFHSKSKMEQIVEGTPAQNITSEHIAAISHKLKALRIIWASNLALMILIYCFFLLLNLFISHISLILCKISNKQTFQRFIIIFLFSNKDKIFFDLK